MAKGASIKFKSYSETVPKLLELIKLQNELKKYDKIVLKPFLTGDETTSTHKDFVEAVVKFCIHHKNPVANIYIAEGADGYDTEELFNSHGYKKLAETYDVSLVDLNKAETEERESSEFLRFATINYPKILSGSFIISMPKLAESEETEIAGSLPSMLGAFPASHYKGWFSRVKSKIRNWPIKYAVHDILRCEIPKLAIVDASSKETILAGVPLEMDKQMAKLLDKDWRTIPYLALLNEKLEAEEKPVEELINV